MAINAQLDPRVGITTPAVHEDDCPDCDLSEEQASQGHKTGHMRWVLLIGFALACLAVAGPAILH
jgi:hypothetical protein